MSDALPIHLHPTAGKRLALPVTRVVTRFQQLLSAGLVALLPAIYLVTVLGLTGLAVYHLHQIIVMLAVQEQFVWGDLRFVAVIVLEVFGAVLLLRQLRPPVEKNLAVREIFAPDQPAFYALVKLIAERVRAPMPKRILVDSSANCRADFPTFDNALWRRDLELRVGLTLPASMSATQWIGCLAHELAFASSGSGCTAAWFVRAVNRWFRLRAREDNWMEAVREFVAEARFHKWVFWKFVQGAVWLSLIPARLLHHLSKALSAPALERMVWLGDACLARLIGHEEAVQALYRRMAASEVYRKEEALHATATRRLPDSLPMLVGRTLMQEDFKLADDVLATSACHWLDGAPSDMRRLRALESAKHEGLMTMEGEGTDTFRGFNELAREVTYFHYLNDLKLKINQHMLVAVEESMQTHRASRETISVLNRYFHGLAHPERAFCGLAAEQPQHLDTEVICVELRDAREWLDTYGERMGTALSEWTHAWQLVRDLEMGLMLVRAEMPLPPGQFSTSLKTPETFEQEIFHHRAIMTNVEDILQGFESRMEARLACALELMWRATPQDMPERLASVRETLPHWVLVYEALGLNLPKLRELLTRFHAFQALGAGVAGIVESPAFVDTVGKEIPRLAAQVKDLLDPLREWPYPFQTNFGNEAIMLAAYVAPRVFMADDLLAEITAATSVQNQTRAAIAAAREIVAVTSQVIERYLNLYHQAFAWITKAADMSEWHFLDPFDPINQMTDLQERGKARLTVPEPPAPPPAAPPVVRHHDPELDYAAA